MRRSDWLTELAFACFGVILTRAAVAALEEAVLDGHTKHGYEDGALIVMDAHRAMRIGLLLAIAAALVALLNSARGIGEADLLAYWSAARLSASIDNPYDPIALLTLQQATRPDRTQERGSALASWNPPWLLVVLLPLGLLPFDVAARAWVLCNIGLILAASVLTWQQLSKSADTRSIALVATASLWFLPSMSTIQMGQISGLVLIALVVAAWGLRTRRDGLAGAALFLATIKPHVTYFVLLLAAVWAARERRWRVLGGMVAAGAISIAILSILLPGWMLAYLRLAGVHSFFQYSASTLGGLAYALWGTHVFRFAGVLLLPLIPWMLRLVDARGWLTAMNVALLLSVPLAMYGFSFDQVVLLPAALEIVAWLWHRELPIRAAWAVLGGLALLYVLMIAVLTLPVLYYHSFAWAPPALAILYALAWRQRIATPAGSDHLER